VFGHHCSLRSLIYSGLIEGLINVPYPLFPNAHLVRRLLSLGRVGGRDRVGRVLAGSLGALIGRAVLEDTLVAGVSSLEGELDALVVTEGGGDLGSGGLRHFEESLRVSGKLGR
jgi:hypothetical protein